MLVPSGSRAALVDHVARLKHDLGKYVALQVRWLDEGADLDARREALTNDLLHTRRGPTGTQDALSVWAEFRPGLCGEVELDGGHRVDLRDDPDVAAIDAAMGALVEVIAALREARADAADLDRGASAAREVSDRCRSLAARARQG